ncbi:hypothetical protein D6777_02200 [Candidatus Woesearchaeota archaeon]|nr:MAG: hypothetical protein D6777_02200 [Candidatus Woesearchaeota archaeon]
MKLASMMKKGRMLVLAYDHGMEHGPTDFNDKNVDPNYIMQLAKATKLPIVLQKGLAEKYYDKSVPLILKLNGKTNLYKGEPYSPPLATVAEAVKMKAEAVGYTVYIGSKYEAKMFKEFELVQREAHKKGLPVMLWVYPRGKSVKNDTDKDVLAYAARVGLELGADVVKLKYPGSVRAFKWVVKSAGEVKVVVAGGVKKDVKGLLKQTYDIVKSGGAGLAVGRNVWQYDKPKLIVKALKDIIFKNKTVDEVMHNDSGKL